MKILGTGLSGLVGSRVVELLTPEFSFENLSKETGVDITAFDKVKGMIESSAAPWVFHFAAQTDVDRAENERGLAQGSETWKVNVTATEQIALACKQTGKRLLYISTDYVFAGTKDFYTEKDIPNPRGWYARTKYEGEKLVLSLPKTGLVVRIANPYRASAVGKPDFVHKILARFQQGQTVQAPADQLFVPTFIDDIANAIRLLVRQRAFGVYHVVGSQALSPYTAAQKIASVFGFDSNTTKPVPFSEFFAGRAPRPFRAVLKNDRITKLGVRMHSFDEGLREVKNQVN